MKKEKLSKTKAVSLYVGVIILSVLITSAGNIKQSAEAQGPGEKKPSVNRLADFDRNGISDGLQEKIYDAHPSELIDVVVTFSCPGNAVSAQKMVGPFKVYKEFRIIRGFSARMTVGQARGLAKSKGVFRVEENFTVHTMLDAAREDFGVTTAHNSNLTGANVGICIVDTGVDPGHEQLSEGKVWGFSDFVNNRIEAYDDHGHGTHVASIAAGDGTGSADAGLYKGVAPDANIYAAKVLDSSGSGYQADIIDGIEWCVQEGVDIISMSLGTSAGSDGQDALSQAVNAAVDKGKVVVVAAGNAGALPETIGSPGAAEKAITVGAAADWSSSEGMYLAPFSSRGPTLDGRIKPDVIAPGVKITAAKAGSLTSYIAYSGTSMATPFVSGAVALALENNKDPANIKNLIKSTTHNWGFTVPNNNYGNGLIDVYAFVVDESAPSDFPQIQRQTGSVPDNSEWVKEFYIDDVNPGIAVTITIEGELNCLLPVGSSCWWWGWDSPDLDADLYDPLGNLISWSTCPLDNEAKNCETSGRQETLLANPVSPGWYTIKIYPFAESPNYGKGGDFVIDVSTGPCGETSSSNNAPTASFTYTTSDLTATFTDTSTDSDGTIASWSWNFGNGVTSTTQNPSHTYAADGTYAVTLTVTDDVGATDSASQSVTVSAPSVGITLSVEAYKIKGTKYADLTWSGATSQNMDILGDGKLILTTENDGEYTDVRSSGRPVTYMVCEAGSTTCSNSVTVSW
jgi:serine protease AprX